MDGFFSKASSFLNSQEKQDSPAPDPSQAEDTKPTKPASSGGYGDLLSGAEALMQKAAKSKDEERPTDTDNPAQKPPSSGSGGYEDLLAGAQKLMGSAKLSEGDQGTQAHGGKEAAPQPGEDSYKDVMASAQVLMGAAKKSREGGGEADMGEVAGATANLIDAASRYGNLEKTGYGDYANKAEKYLRDYEASHGSKTAGAAKPAAEAGDGNTGLPAGADRPTPTAIAGKQEGKGDQEGGALPSGPQDTHQPKSANEEGSGYDFSDAPAPPA